MAFVSTYVNNTQLFKNDMFGLTSDIFEIETLTSRTATVLSLPGAFEGYIRGTADKLDVPLATKALLKILPYIGPSMSKIFLATDNAEAQLNNIANVLGRVDGVVKPAYNIVKPLDDKLFIALGVSATIAADSIVVHDEAVILQDSLEYDWIPSRSYLTALIDNHDARVDAYVELRDVVLDGLDLAKAALSEAVDRIESALPDLSIAEDAFDTVEAVFGPVKSAMLSLERTLNNTIITIVPEVRDPIFGTVIIPAQKASMATILKNIDNYISAIQNAVLGAFQSALNGLGINFPDVAATIQQQMNAVLAPLLALVADLEAQIAPLVEPIRAAVEALGEAFDSFWDSVLGAYDASRLFVEVSFGDETSAEEFYADYLGDKNGLAPEGFFGLKGNDVINANLGEDYVFGGIGNDELYSGVDDDEIFGGRGADVADAGSGNDDLWMGSGKDTADGGEGDDFIKGQKNADLLRGGDGNDTVGGDEGRDTVYGQDGNDKVSGGNGKDLVGGGLGDDQVFGGKGGDILLGGGGMDTLEGEEGNDTLNGGSEDDQMFGGLGNDFLTGKGGDDLMRGDADDDTLLGGLGDDTLRGGDGEDSLVGGEDDDVLYGGEGADVFRFFPTSGSDTIKDWQDGLDLLQMNAALGIDDIAISDQGSDALVEYQGNSLLIMNAAGVIDADDFIGL